MRILHLIDTYPSPTETFIKAFVKKSESIGELSVATFHQVTENSLHNNIYKISNRYPSPKNLKGLLSLVLDRVFGWSSWRHSLNKIIKTVNPDVIHCHFGTMGVLMAQLIKRYKIDVPFVTSFYGYDASSLPRTDSHYRDNLNQLWKSGSGFFAEGPALKSKLIALGCPGDKCYLNPLLINISEYPVKQHYRKVNTPIKFLFVGRFVEKKGFQLFLEAIHRLKPHIDAFTITVVGSGPMLDYYENLIANLQLSSQIIWLGMLPHQQVITMLPEFDFLVHPSLTAADGDSEGGAPTIIIEAQAVGLPVITTRHADIPYIMGYDDFLAEENDVDSLEQAIAKILDCTNINDYVVKGQQKVFEQHNFEQSKTYRENLNKALIN